MEFILSTGRFFAEFTLSKAEVLRMTRESTRMRGESTRMRGESATMTGSEGLAMTSCRTLD